MMMIKDMYNKYKEKMAAKAKSEEPDVFKTMADILTKEDIAKVMMGKSHELNHLPPKIYDVIKE